MINRNRFEGIFKSEIKNYITFKQSLGFYRKNFEDKYIYLLINLNNFLNSCNLKEIKITKKMTEQYISNDKNLAPSTMHHRECTLRQFSIFLKNQGYKNIYINYHCKVKRDRNFVPYVFTSEEIRQIFSAIDSIEFKRYKNRKLFYQVLFRLLYCTGLRLGEALNLKNEDVDLDNDVLTIYSGKGNVSRLVPINIVLSNLLQNYKTLQNTITSEYFFKSPQGGRYANSTIGHFLKHKIFPLAGIISIKTDKIRRGACVHSFRHTFACNSLDLMIKAGKDPYCALPYLSIYLGHTSLVNTEIYLRLTAERHNEVINQGHYIYEKIKGERN